MATKDISDAEVCRAFLDAHGSGVFADALLIERTGQPEKVVYRAMERANRHNLVEYGVSLRSGWITPEGRKLIGAPDRPPLSEADINALLNPARM